MSLDGVLFDLDGTLVDTAPDLVGALNRLLVETGRPPMPFAIARNEVSNGANGLLRLGFSLAPDEPVDADLRRRLLAIYAESGHNKSRLFIALQEILNCISSIRGRWGIVTNKPAAFTETLLARLGLTGRVGCVVSGDTLPERKPHPAPLELAAAQLDAAVGDCVYLGDAQRDIVAGRAAGMRTVSTSYGYIRPGEDVRRWGADANVDHPRKIPAMLRRLSETV